MERTPPREALEILLKGTGLKITSWTGSVVTLGATASASRSSADAGESIETGSSSGAMGLDGTAAAEPEIVVTGVRAALQSSADKKREADNIRDVVTAEDIGKFPDENVTDSLARIPGVQITRDIGEGSGFTIRGISQNRVSINGRTAIGRDEGRNPNIGDISADLLGGLEVIKSPTADMVGGSLGGTVNLVTRRPTQCMCSPSDSSLMEQGASWAARCLN